MSKGFSDKRKTGRSFIMPKVQHGFLKCTVTSGMFSDEKAVTVVDVTGEQHSFFVPKKTIRGDSSVTVTIQPAKNGIYARIPTPEPNSIVFVKAEDVE
jgi:hypothetical protein